MSRNKIRANKLTIGEMKARAPKWFEKGAMNFFNTVIETGVCKGNYFITSDRMELSYPKKYSIRHFDTETNTVSTVGEFQEYNSLASAKTALRRLQAQNEQ